MKYLLDLPDDVLLHVLHYFILNSSVEELIGLEIVCRRLRQLCLSHACWVDALETLDTRPPLITSRSTLLALSASDLRDEIVRAVKLDRSWASEAGPMKVAEDLILVADELPKAHKNLLPLPEVDLIFASYPRNRIRCWSTVRNRLIWDYVACQDAELSIPPNPSELEFACDVLDDSTTVLIALLFSRNTGDKRTLQIHQLDTLSFECKPIFECSMPCASVQHHNVQLRGDYVVVGTALYRREHWYIVVNWKLGTFYKIMEYVDDDTCRAKDITRDAMFLLLWETCSTYRIVGIRYRDLRGSSSSVCADWPSYNAEDLIGLGVYTSTLLPFGRAFQYSLQATVSSWSRSPSTHLTVMFNLSGRPRDSCARISIFKGTYAVGDNGQGTFTFDLGTIHKKVEFFAAPSISMRALIHVLKGYDECPVDPATCYLRFDDHQGGGALQEKIHPLKIFDEDCAYHEWLWMDSLGMVVCKMGSNCIIVARLAERRNTLEGARG